MKPENSGGNRDLAQQAGMTKPESSANIAGFEWWNKGPWSVDTSPSDLSVPLADRAARYTEQHFADRLAKRKQADALKEPRPPLTEQETDVKADLDTEYLVNEPRRKFVAHMEKWREDPSHRFEPNEVDVKAAKQSGNETEYYRQRNLRSPGETRDRALMDQARSYAESHVAEAMKQDPYLKLLGREEATFHLTAEFINRQMTADFLKNHESDFVPPTPAEATINMRIAARMRTDRDIRRLDAQSPGAHAATLKARQITDEAYRSQYTADLLKKSIDAAWTNSQLRFRK